METKVMDVLLLFFSFKKFDLLTQLSCSFAHVFILHGLIQNFSFTSMTGIEQDVSVSAGVEDLVSQNPVTASTLFNIASTSKAFATVLLSKQLRESTE